MVTFETNAENQEFYVADFNYLVKDSVWYLVALMCDDIIVKGFDYELNSGRKLNLALDYSEVSNVVDIIKKI